MESCRFVFREEGILGGSCGYMRREWFPLEVALNHSQGSRRPFHNARGFTSAEISLERLKEIKSTYRKSVHKIC